MTMRHFQFATLFLIPLLAATFSGCAHSYHYTPEIAGGGAIWSGRGIIFSIPTNSPELRMKISSPGFEKAPSSAHLPASARVLVVRMAFKNTKQRAPDSMFFLDPKEQALLLWENTVVHPALVHARGTNRIAFRSRELANSELSFFTCFRKMPGNGISSRSP